MAEGTENETADVTSKETRVGAKEDTAEESGRDEAEEQQQQEEPQQKQQQETQQEPIHEPTEPKPHLWNSDAHPTFLRFGIPAVLCAAFALLLSSDIAGAVKVDLILYDREEDEELNSTTIITVSIFSSVVELFKAESYALAILVLLTSVSWPYVKLLAALFSWVLVVKTPGCCRKSPTRHRQEWFIEFIDMSGKWSFVDIMVLILVMVAFHTTIPILYGIEYKTYITPQWGFYGFVTASSLTDLVIHLILYRHRLVVVSEKEAERVKQEKYDEKQQLEQGLTVQQQQNGNTLTPRHNESVLLNFLGLTVFLLGGCCYIVGCSLESFKFTYEQGRLYEEESFSVLSIGTRIPDATRDGDNFFVRCVQFMFFLIVFAIPLHNVFFSTVVYLIVVGTKHVRVKTKRWLFTLVEISYAWACADVFALSTFVSVYQIPKFGTGIIESGCSECYVVGAELIVFPFVLLLIGVLIQTTGGYILLKRMHPYIY